MADTTRILILAALLARVQGITVDAGFMTNAGEKVFLGETPGLGKDDPDTALAIIVGDEVAAVPGQKLKTLIDLPIEVQMLAKVTIAQAWLTAEAGLGDIKRAIEEADRTLGGVARGLERGPVRTLPRERGATDVGIGATYIVQYTETWGAP